MDTVADIFLLSRPRYMCLRAMVMAYYDSGFDNTKPVDGDGLHCPTVRAALEPFCGQRRKPFRGPEDAIKVLGPIAEQVSSRDRMETFFPPEFAGCLHDSTHIEGSSTSICRIG